MDKNDYKILLEKVYKEGLTVEGLSLKTLEEIKDILNIDSLNINSVFGVYMGLDMWDKEEIHITVSEAKTWEEEGYCSDYTDDDSHEVLEDMGFGRLEDGIYGPSPDLKKHPTKDEIIEKLTSLGFKYSEDFENFIMDSME